MNQFLADHYGTGGDQGLTEDEAALEKMAQLTLLVKEAEEEGIDLSELTEEEEDILDKAAGATIHSRLGCQCRIHGNVAVEIP